MHRHDEHPEPAELPCELAAELRELDVELTAALRVDAPRELVERIEVALGVYDPSLERALRREVGVDMPGELADEIAGSIGLADVELDRDLRTALAAGPAPGGLTDRIVAATSPVAASPMVARIGFAAVWRGAIAAALLAAITAALYVSTLGPTPADPGETKPVVASVDDDDLTALEQRFAAAFAAEAPQPVLDEKIGDLSADIDALTVALAFGSQDDPLDAYTEQLNAELDLFEQHLGSF